MLSDVTFIIGTEWVDPEDPTVIAENELLRAAAAIEAAAKKLEQLQPRAKPKVIKIHPQKDINVLYVCSWVYILGKNGIIISLLINYPVRNRVARPDVSS